MEVSQMRTILLCLNRIRFPKDVKRLIVNHVLITNFEEIKIPGAYYGNPNRTRILKNDLLFEDLIDESRADFIFLAVKHKPTVFKLEHFIEAAIRKSNIDILKSIETEFYPNNKLEYKNIFKNAAKCIMKYPMDLNIIKYTYSISKEVLEGYVLIAVQEGRLDIANWLIENDIPVKYDKHKFYKYEQLIFLIEYGYYEYDSTTANYTIMNSLIHDKDIRKTSHLYELGFPVDDNIMNTVTYVIVQKGDIETMDWLLSLQKRPESMDEKLKLSIIRKMPHIDKVVNIDQTDEQDKLIDINDVIELLTDSCIRCSNIKVLNHLKEKYANNEYVCEQIETAVNIIFEKST